MDPEAGNAGQNEIIRSGNSLERAFVMFVNSTYRVISIFWIDFSGNPVIYVQLVPNAVVEINTFRSHAWLFRDSKTGERLQVQRQSVYWAQPYFTRNPRNQNEIVPARKQLQIHVPLMALREIMLWYVVSKLNVTSEDAICQFGLPKTLTDDLTLHLKKVLAFSAIYGP